MSVLNVPRQAFLVSQIAETVLMVGKSPKRRVPAGDWVVKSRWLIAGLMSLLALLTLVAGLGVVSRGLFGTRAFAAHARWEISLFVIVWPLAFGLSLSVLGRARARSTEQEADAAQRQKDAAQDERRRISQELHDTLAQQLGYLYLALERMSAGAEMDRGQVAQLRDIANDAYEQVRMALTALRPTPDGSLAGQLYAHARLAGSRAGFEVHVESQGEAQTLSEQAQRRLLYLLREALANVEKHAGARRVDMLLDWQPDSLRVWLADDGRGFAPNGESAPGHFGMLIMQEHARELHAGLEVASEPGAGTQVTVTLPLPVAA